jgi:hypothetical protein
MNPHEQYEISPTEKPSGQSHTPGQVFNLVLAAQNGSVEACMEVSRCFTEGDGVPENQVAACAWLLVAASNGSETAEAELVILRSRLSPEEAQEAEAQAKEYFYSSDAVGYPEAMYDEFNLVMAEKLAQQSEQKLTAEDVMDLLYRADADDEEAQRIIFPMMENLRVQMTPEEKELLEQQISVRLSAVCENHVHLNERLTGQDPL